MTPDEMQTRGRRALVAELGAVNAARFIMRNKLGRGDYTAERGAIIDGLTPDEIVAGIEARKKLGVRV